MGPNSENQDNILPGSATLNVGHWDGVTVYDFDSDGLAEVAVRIANGITFGDREVFKEVEENSEQFIAIIDGLIGALRASSKVPNAYKSHGRLAPRFGIGYLDDGRPYFVTYMKVRQSDQSVFNLAMAAWTFVGFDVT